MATWPSTLVITRDNYTETTPKRSVRSDMDVGPAKIRKRTSLATRTVSFSMFLTSDQLEVFDAFYDANESISFDFTSVRTGNAERARFSSTPKYSAYETMWNVSVELELLP